MWPELHRGLIAGNGEYVSTHLAQTGSKTFPYFQEADRTAIESGDLFCIDTDAIGPEGCAVDSSRAFSVGGDPSRTRRSLHGLARDQLDHNAGLLEPGRPFESFARDAWPVPTHHEPYGYYCITDDGAEPMTTYPFDQVFD